MFDEISSYKPDDQSKNNRDILKVFKNKLLISHLKEIKMEY